MTSRAFYSVENREKLANVLSNFTKKVSKILIFSAYLSYRASEFKIDAK